MNAADVRTQLVQLTAERLEATEAGLTSDPAYMAELASDIAEARAAYTLLAVTEIASFRAELSGPQVG